MLIYFTCTICIDISLDMCLRENRASLGLSYDLKAISHLDEFFLSLETKSINFIKDYLQVIFLQNIGNNYLETCQPVY